MDAARGKPKGSLSGAIGRIEQKRAREAISGILSTNKDGVVVELFFSLEIASLCREGQLKLLEAVKPIAF